MTISRSNRISQIHSDIRGPLYVEALRMQAAGERVLKLNTGNPASFGFTLPESVRTALTEHVDEAVPYCDVRGMEEAGRRSSATTGAGACGTLPWRIFLSATVSARR